MSVSRLLRNGLRFWRNYGTRQLLRELQRRLTTPLPPGMATATSALPPPRSPAARHQPVAAPALLAARFHMLSPLKVFVVPREARPRITLITDSISQGSFFGGVATSLLLAMLLAERRGARLRIVTRVEPPHGGHLKALSELYGVKPAGEVEFVFAHVSASQAQLNVQDDELFITTSWWTTQATLDALAPQRILYLLQEDERAFYPSGEDQLRCQQVLAHEGLHVVVNTAGLLEHLIANGLPGLQQRALAFEPAFPRRIFHPRARPADGRRRLMFYARPLHLRNLFYFGLELIDRAVAEGLLDTRQWEIHFVGASIPPLTLCDGSEPLRHEHIDWREYTELVGTMDLGISLMNTPHPSYPPLDLAASGAVVLSNRYGNKTDLSAACANIILAELSMPAMLEGLKQALALVDDDAERRRRHAAHRLGQEWPEALSGVLDHFGSKSDAWA